MTDELRLNSVHNVRDVAGAGLAPGGGVMTRGLVYRGTVLTVDDDDLAALERAGITRVVDLRTAHEVAKQADRMPAGADYVHVDVLAGHHSAAEFGSTLPDTADSARADMIQTYESFVRGGDERAAFGRAIRAVATSDGPVLVHCTAGKDRTGWVSALLQLLAGASDDEVMAEYLLTNELSADFVESIRALVRDSMPGMLEVADVLLSVDERYLRTALDALRADFGSVENYLVEGAGLEPELVEGLRARLGG